MGLDNHRADHRDHRRGLTSMLLVAAIMDVGVLGQRMAGDLACGGIYTGDTTGSEHVVGTPSGEAYYRLTVLTTGPYVFSTCEGSSYDTLLRLFSGDHLEASSTEIANDDDGCGPFNVGPSQIEATLEPGSYTVVVEDVGSNEGAFTLSLSCPEQSRHPRQTVDPTCEFVIQFANGSGAYDCRPEVDPLYEGITSIADSCSPYPLDQRTRRFHLGKSGITEIPMGLFDHTPDLLEFQLEQNAISVIPTGLFDHTPALQRVDLDNNAITAIPTRLFDHTPDLRVFHLEQNAISLIPTGLFDHTPAIQEIWLRANRITAIPSGLFDSSAGFIQVQMGGNALRQIPTIVFARGIGSVSRTQFFAANVPGLQGCTLHQDGTASCSGVCSRGLGSRVMVANDTIMQCEPFRLATSAQPGNGGCLSRIAGGLVRPDVGGAADATFFYGEPETVPGLEDGSSGTAGLDDVGLNCSEAADLFENMYTPNGESGPTITFGLDIAGRNINDHKDVFINPQTGRLSITASADANADQGDESVPYNATITATDGSGADGVIVASWRMNFRSRPTFALKNELNMSASCASALATFTNTTERITTYYTNEPTFIEGITAASSNCDFSDLLENAYADDSNSISYQLWFDGGQPGEDVYTNAFTGRVSLNPTAVGDFNASLVALDRAGNVAVVRSWAVHSAARPLIERLPVAMAASDLAGIDDPGTYTMYAAGSPGDLSLGRSIWAVGITYKLPPVKLTWANTGGDVIGVRYILRPTPPGFFLNAETGEILGVPRNASENFHNASRSSQMYAVALTHSPVLLGTFVFEYRYPDTSANAAGGADSAYGGAYTTMQVVTENGAVAGHDCDAAARFENQRAGSSEDAEFDGLYRCPDLAATLPELAVVSIDPDSRNNTGGDSEYQEYAPPSSDEPELVAMRQHWAIGTTYSLPEFSVRGFGSVDGQTPVQIGGSDDLSGATSIGAINVNPLPEGFFLNTQTGELLGKYLGHPTQSETTAIITVSAPGLIKSTAIGNITFNFQHKDTSTDNPRFNTNGPHGLPCINSGVPYELRVMELHHEFDGSYLCNCNLTNGYGGDNCEITPIEAAASGNNSGDTANSSMLVLVIGLLGIGLLVIGLLATAANKIHHKKQIESRLQALATSEQGSYSSTELTDAVFQALDNNLDALVPQLFDRGADPTARHPATQQLAHVILLARSHPDHDALLQLFSLHLRIDDQTGALLDDPEKLSVLQSVLKAMAVQGWRDQTTSSTVLHRTIDACHHGSILPQQALSLAQAILASDLTLLTAKDMLAKTAGDIAMQCDGAVDLERLLTVVVHSAFQLTKPTEHLYRSSTALVMECRVLPDSTAMPSLRHESAASAAQPAANHTRLVLKLMTDFDSWHREVLLRGALPPKAAGSIVPILSVASTRADTPKQIGRFNVIGRANLELDESTNRATHVHDLAADLMNQYPFALCMERADRNLLEIISNERLADDELGSIRYKVVEIAQCLAILHDASIIHGDVKPRNIVRTTGNAIKLIDFDMAFKPVFPSLAPSDGPSSSGLPDKHATASKVRGTNAYATPELARWASDGSGDVAQDPMTSMKDAIGLDIWSFGATVFEMVTGTPMIQNSYDKATENALEELVGWKGLSPVEEKQIRDSHLGQDATTLIDLLQWITAPDPVARPANMSDVLGHAFLDPGSGAMREHFVVNHIRELLSGSANSRPCVQVMISYCWADTTFVLDRLCVTLAPLVQTLWLDRLGGDQGMGEWTRDSMEQGVAGADVIISVVSPEYIKSKNCGFEMDLASAHGKTVVPIMLGVPFAEWPPAKIGEATMSNQYADPSTGDMKLFIDFSRPELFATKFKHELLPRIERHPKSWKTLQNVLVAAQPATHAQDAPPRPQSTGPKLDLEITAVMDAPIRPQSTGPKLDLEITAVMGDLGNSAPTNAELPPPSADTSFGSADELMGAVLLEHEAGLLAEMPSLGQVSPTLNTPRREEPALTITTTGNSVTTRAADVDEEEDDRVIGEVTEAVSVQMIEVMSEHLIEGYITTVSGELLTMATASTDTAVPAVPASLPRVRGRNCAPSRGTKIAPAPL